MSPCKIKGVGGVEGEVDTAARGVHGIHASRQAASYPGVVTARLPQVVITGLVPVIQCGLAGDA